MCFAESCYVNAIALELMANYGSSSFRSQIAVNERAYIPGSKNKFFLSFFVCLSTAEEVVQSVAVN